MNKQNVQTIIQSLCKEYAWKKNRFQCVKEYHHYDENFYSYFDNSEDVKFCCMEFKIKEIPKWIFGLWISERVSNNTTCFDYKFFGADERDIDKFKPSHVENMVEGTAFLDEDSQECNYYIDGVRLLNFVRKHRILANYREIRGVDYNIKPVGIVAATLWLCRHRYTEWSRKQWNRLIEYKTTHYFKKQLIKDFLPTDDIWVNIDENRSPRSELFVVIPCYDEDIERKCGSIWHKEASPKVFDIAERWSKIGKIFGINVYFPEHVGQFYTIMSQADFQLYKENSEDSNFKFKLLHRGKERVCF